MMNNFHLGSIDWDTVQLLHGEHLTQETAYLEDLVRWVLYYGFPRGVVAMDADSLVVVPSSSTTYRVTLRRCRAITPQGYGVDIGDDESAPAFDLDKEQHLDRVVRIYLGVDTTEKERQPMHPTRSSALLECQSRWRRYVLDYEHTSEEMDWLQIGQIINRGGELVLDPDFIPECVYLNSYPQLMKKVKDIRDLAEHGLRALEQYTSSAVDISVATAAGQFAASLASAAVVVDWQAHPRAYIERLIMVLMANRMLVTVLCPVNMGYRDDVLSAIANALNYVQGNTESDLPLGPALERIRQALEVLIKLFGQLNTVPRPEPVQPRIPEDRRYTAQPIKRK